MDIVHVGSGWSGMQDQLDCDGIRQHTDLSVIRLPARSACLLISEKPLE